MTDPTDDLLALATATVDIPIGDGKAPAAALDAKGIPTRPLAVLIGGAGDPADRRLTAARGGHLHTWQLLAISNNAASVRRMTGAYVTALDGARLPAGQLLAAQVGPLIEDRDDPTAWRWSCTVELSTSTYR